MKLKLQVVLVPLALAELPTSEIASYKKFLHLTDPQCSVKEVCDALVQRYYKLYPDAEPLQIEGVQDKDRCDLDPDFAAEDIFASGDLVRIVVNNVLPTYSREASTILPESFTDALGLRKRLGDASLDHEDSRFLKRSRTIWGVQRESASPPQIEGAGQTAGHNIEQHTSTSALSLKPPSPVSLPPPVVDTSGLHFIPYKKPSPKVANKGKRITSGMLQAPVDERINKKNLFSDDESEVSRMTTDFGHAGRGPANSSEPEEIEDGTESDDLVLNRLLKNVRLHKTTANPAIQMAPPPSLVGLTPSKGPSKTPAKGPSKTPLKPQPPADAFATLTPHVANANAKAQNGAGFPGQKGMATITPGGQPKDLNSQNTQTTRKVSVDGSNGASTQKTHGSPNGNDAFTELKPHVPPTVLYAPPRKQHHPTDPVGTAPLSPTQPTGNGSLQMGQQPHLQPPAEVVYQPPPLSVYASAKPATAAMSDIAVASQNSSVKPPAAVADKDDLSSPNRKAHPVVISLSEELDTPSGSPQPISNAVESLETSMDEISPQAEAHAGHHKNHASPNSTGDAQTQQSAQGSPNLSKAEIMGMFKHGLRIPNKINKKLAVTTPDPSRFLEAEDEMKRRIRAQRNIQQNAQEIDNRRRAATAAASSSNHERSLRSRTTLGGLPNFEPDLDPVEDAKEKEKAQRASELPQPFNDFTSKSKLSSVLVKMKKLEARIDKQKVEQAPPKKVKSEPTTPKVAESQKNAPLVAPIPSLNERLNSVSGSTSSVAPEEEPSEEDEPSEDDEVLQEESDFQVGAIDESAVEDDDFQDSQPVGEQEESGDDDDSEETEEEVTRRVSARQRSSENDNPNRRQGRAAFKKRLAKQFEEADIILLDSSESEEEEEEEEESESPVEELPEPSILLKPANGSKPESAEANSSEQVPKDTTADTSTVTKRPSDASSPPSKRQKEDLPVKEATGKPKEVESVKDSSTEETVQDARDEKIIPDKSQKEIASPQSKSSPVAVENVSAAKELKVEPKVFTPSNPTDKHTKTETKTPVRRNSTISKIKEVFANLTPQKFSSESNGAKSEEKPKEVERKVEQTKNQASAEKVKPEVKVVESSDDSSSSSSSSDSSDSSDSDSSSSESEEEKKPTKKPEPKKVISLASSRLLPKKLNSLSSRPLSKPIPTPQAPQPRSHEGGVRTISILTPFSKSSSDEDDKSKGKKKPLHVSRPLLHSLTDLAKRGVPEVKEVVGKSTVVGTIAKPEMKAIASEIDSESESDSDSSSSSSSSSSDSDLDSDSSADENDSKFVSVKKLASQGGAKDKKKKKGGFSSLMKDVKRR